MANAVDVSPGDAAQSSSAAETPTVDPTTSDAPTSDVPAMTAPDTTASATESPAAESPATDSPVADAPTTPALESTPAPQEPAKRLTRGLLASGAASTLSLVLVSDGTAPFDADDAPGNDSSANNGIVRTNDSVVYRWDYSNVTAGDVTISQALPAGMQWDLSSTASCVEGASAISANKLTLSCTLANAPAGSGSYLAKAIVGGAPNGAALTSHATSGALVSNDITVTASGAPRVEVDAFQAGVNQRSVKGGVEGVQMVPGISFFTRVDPAKGLKGREALTDFTFSVDVSKVSPLAVPNTCGPRSPDTRPYHQIGYVAAATATNSVQNSGTWTCTQPGGPGTPIIVNVVGANTDALTYPSRTSNNGTVSSSLAYMIVGAVVVWAPSTEFTTPRAATIQVKDFDPDSLSGQSNFGSGYAPGQTPGQGEVPGVNQYSTTINTSASGALSVGGDMWDATGTVTYQVPALPGGTTARANDAPLFPGQGLRIGGYIDNSASTSPDPSTNVAQCFVWNTGQLKATPSAQLALSTSGAASTAGAIIEYSNQTFSSDTDRKNVDCGTAGDGNASWFPSIAAAGGPDAVSAYRFLVPTVGTGRVYSALPMVRTSDDIAAGTPIPVFQQFKADGRALTKSTYVPATNTGSMGARTIASTAAVRVTDSWDLVSGKPGTARTITVTPTVTDLASSGTARTATDVRVTTTLSSPCMSFLAGSVSPYPVTTVTPPDLGPDGIACTADDGAGAVLEWDLGDVSTADALAPITFQVYIDSDIVMPTTLTATSVISSPSDITMASFRTATATLQVNSPVELAITKTASATTIQPGDSVTYSLAWINKLPISAGTAHVVDVLPYNGDVNGTHDLAGLTVGDVTASAGVEIQFTTDGADGVVAALLADASGGTGIAWTSTKPASGITAVRFTSPELASGARGSGDIVVTPRNLVRATSFTNSVTSGQATALASAVQNAAPVTVSATSAVLSGNVYQDKDYSWTQNAGDTALAGTTVTLTGYSFGADGIDDGGPGHGDDLAIVPMTTTSSANGDYSFDGLRSGSYSAAVTAGVPSTLSAAAAAPMPVVLAAGATSSGHDFGFIQTLPAPVLVADVLKISVNTSGTVTPLANDTVDPSATIASTSAPAHGTVVDNGDGTYTYTPATDYVGTDAFTYTVTDKSRQSATGTVTITVTAAPVANADTHTVRQAPATVLDVLSNDTGDAIALDAIVTAPSHGTASIAAGKISYTPAAGYVGADSFSYRIKDSLGLTASTTASITVQAAPVAIAHTAQTGVARPVSIAVLDGATLPTPLATTITVTQGTHGSAAVQGDGTVTYTPSAGYSGTDTFTYTLTDALGQVSSAIVTITVKAAPTATADAAKVQVGQSVSFNELARNTVPFPAVTTVTTSTPAHGTVSIGADGVILYIPAAGYAGTDTFSYTLTDDVSQTATATITVTMQAAPLAVADSAKTGVGAPVTVNVLGNDTVPFPSGSVVSVVGTPSSGTAVAANGTVTFTPEPGFTGTATFIYLVTDDLTQSSSAQVTITVQAAPIAVDDAIRTGSGTAIEIPVLDNDTLPDAAGTSVSVGTPSHGIAVVTAGGVTYTPAAGFSGTDTFTYTISDDVAQSSTATVTVTVVAGPVANDDAAEGPHGVAITVDLLGNDQGDGIAISSVDQGMFGSVVDNGDGTVTYTPNDGFSGVDAFEYTIRDSMARETSARVTLTLFAAPVMDDVTFTTGQSSPHSFSPLSSGPLAAASASTDVYAPLVLTAVGAAAHGTAVLNADGSITYVPSDGYFGEDTFKYTATDSVGQSVTATAHVMVQAVPTATTIDVKTSAGTEIAVDVLAAVTGSNLSLGVVSAPAHGTASIVNGRVVYVPADGFVGSDQFSVQVIDDLGQTVSVLVRVTVEPGVGESPAVTGASPQLPSTGADILPYLLTAIGLMLLGFGLFLARRRRSTED